ncbi:hypothetical protein GOM49_07135 [Clostridium bovifaecis]|uniref:Uncharacterized protein n=1 Tax=Clostridium bovifaecis TaxID=2184719 RepID=A0A6I6ER54_9CLOT|nr:hypothetical protein GOM49_07135 [Clostridium bovifaecis]
MDFNTDDRVDNDAYKVENEEMNENMDMDLDMDMDYDMVPMPMYMQGMTLGMTPPPPCMQGMMGMTQGNQGLYPMMGMMPQGMPEMMPKMMPQNMSGMMPKMMEENMHGMNMMEMEDEEYSEEENDLENNSRIREYGPNDINRILTKIERYNPGVFAFLRRCGLSYPMAKRFIRRIVRLTLMYYED